MYIYTYIYTWQILVVHGEDDDQVEEGRKNFKPPSSHRVGHLDHLDNVDSPEEAVRRRNFKQGGASWSNSFPCLSFRAGVTRLCLRIVRVRVPVISNRFSGNMRSRERPRGRINRY